MFWKTQRIVHNIHVFTFSICEENSHFGFSHVEVVIIATVHI